MASGCEHCVSTPSSHVTVGCCGAHLHRLSFTQGRAGGEGSCVGRVTLEIKLSSGWRGETGSGLEWGPERRGREARPPAREAICQVLMLVSHFTFTTLLGRLHPGYGRKNTGAAGG